MTFPDRPPDREYTFSLDDEPPSPGEFVRILEEAGFTFETATDAMITLRQPKEALIDEAAGLVVYRQWDQS